MGCCVNTHYHTFATASLNISVMKKEGILSFADRRSFVIEDLEALLTASGDDADGGVIV